MDLEALEQECDITFTRASGPGGQHRNKAETAVRLVHRPTGITVVAADSRSQYQNRVSALQRLAERLEAIEQRRRAADKRRRRKRTRPSAAARRRRLDSKRRQSRKKDLRGRVRPGDDT